MSKRTNRDRIALAAVEKQLEKVALSDSGLTWTTSGGGDSYIVYRKNRDPQASMVGSYKSEKAAMEHIRTGQSQPGNELKK